jgi:uroporphyrinogen decarboxylase
MGWDGQLDVTRLNYVYEAIRLTRAAINGRIPLIGFIGGPWTLLCYMVEGTSDKDMPRAKAFLANHRPGHYLLRLLFSSSNLSISHKRC